MTLKRIGYVLLTLFAIALNSIPFLLSKLFYNFMSPTNFWEKFVFLIIIIIPFFVSQMLAFIWAAANVERCAKEWKNKDEKLEESLT